MIYLIELSKKRIIFSFPDFSAENTHDQISVQMTTSAAYRNIAIKFVIKMSGKKSNQWIISIWNEPLFIEIEDRVTRRGKK